jgi:hypothetical protein
MLTKWFDVAGQVYKVTQGYGGQIFLHGVRGACYVLVPFSDDQTRYHVVNDKGHTPRNFRGVVLQIVENFLEVV